EDSEKASREASGSQETKMKIKKLKVPLEAAETFDGIYPRSLSMEEKSQAHSRLLAMGEADKEIQKTNAMKNQLESLEPGRLASPNMRNCCFMCQATFMNRAKRSQMRIPWWSARRGSGVWLQNSCKQWRIGCGKKRRRMQMLQSSKRSLPPSR
ncbi:unnamed protein product, partial [Durusdinium trenchii]